MVGIAGVKPTICTFHYAFDLFHRVNRISDYPNFELLDAMNWRGVVKGYPKGEEAT